MQSYTFLECAGPVHEKHSRADNYVGTFKFKDYPYDVWYNNGQMKVAEKDGYSPSDVVGLFGRMLFGDRPHATVYYALTMVVSYLQPDDKTHIQTNGPVNGDRPWFGDYCGTLGEHDIYFNENSCLLTTKSSKVMCFDNPIELLAKLINGRHVEPLVCRALIVLIDYLFRKI